MKSKNDIIVNNYEQLCRQSNIDIITSGRYFLNSVGYVKYLAKDIVEKLDLQKSDLLIDIGCNVGIYHSIIKDKVTYLLGMDAGQEIINKARQRNNFPNVEYRVFDALKHDWKSIDKKFNKALIYSVIHFFDNIDDVENFLKGILQIMEQKCTIMLGEVRDKQLYREFEEDKKRNKITIRNIKFKINKVINSVYISKKKSNNETSVACTVYDSSEIQKVAAKLGLGCKMIRQNKKHPFYNTCVDYILERK